MPNHITNILDVTGNTKDVNRFKEMVYSFKKNPDKDNYDSPHYFDFNATVPMPEEIKNTTKPCPVAQKEIQAENIKKYGAGNWYDWSIKYWGTKWGAYSVNEPEGIESGWRFRFNTAWGPGIAWQFFTAQQFPKLRFVDIWIDEGGGAGRYTVWTEKGETKENDESITDHEWRIDFDEGYQHDYYFITKGDYDEVLKTCLEKDYEFYYSSLEPFFVQRVKDKDLPLLVGKEFVTDESRKIFEERLKGK